MQRSDARKRQASPITMHSDAHNGLTEDERDLIAKHTPAHDCSTCADCIHNGNRCCGCYDGACCRESDVSERDELAQVIYNFCADNPHAIDDDLADAILAAGWRRR